MTKLTNNTNNLYKKNVGYKFKNDKIKNHKKNNKNEKNDSDDESDSESVNESIMNDIKMVKNFMGKAKEHDKFDVIDNHIYFKTSVNMTSITKLIKEINGFNDDFKSLKISTKNPNLTPMPVYLHITTCGGSLYDVLYAYDVIKNSQVPIYTICEGYVASAGTILSIAGHKRIMTANTNYLIHQMTSGIFGTYENIKDHMYNSDFLMNKLTKIYLENSKMTKKMLTELMKKDILYGIEECMKYGLIDEVYSKDTYN
jgi:ATP-dependent protease ClpP protease subunit